MTREKLLSKLDLIEKRIGNTPIVPLTHPDVDLYAKVETVNFMGSIKDRAAYAIIRGAVERGEIDQDTTVIEASSGNFAVSCSTICHILGLQFIAVVDPGINSVYEKLITFFAHDMIKVTQRDEKQGYLLTKLKTVRDYLEHHPGAFWTNQYGNQDNFLAHYHGTGVEICKHFQKLDYIFVAVATGGTLAGVSCRLKEHFPDIKVIAVDTEGSVIFGGPPKPRLIPGMGSGMVPPLMARARFDDVVTVREEDTARACKALIEREALFLGGSSGTCYHAVLHYFRENPVSHRPSVLFLNPDRGHGYVDNLYDESWLSWFTTQSQPFPSQELEDNAVPN